MVFYNGATHWISAMKAHRFQAIKIEYMALKKSLLPVFPSCLPIPLLLKHCPLDCPPTLKAVFTPVNATYNEVVWESLNPR
jgi:hypothetical protein